MAAASSSQEAASQDAAAASAVAEVREASSGDAAAPSTSDTTLQLSVLFGMGVLLQMGTGMIVPVLPTYATSLGLAESDVGLLIAIPAAARAVLNLPAGRLADLFGRKRPMVVGGILDGLGTCGTALAFSLPSMVGSRLVMGGGGAIAGPALEAYTQDVVNAYPHHKGRLLGVRQSMATLAWVAGPVVGGWLAAYGGVGLPFLLVGGATLAAVPVMQVLLPESRRALPEARAAAWARAQSGGGGAVPWREQLRPLLREAARDYRALCADHNQRALLLAQCGLFVGWSATLAVVPLYAASVYGAGPKELGSLYAAMAVLGVVGGPAGGWLADTVGRKPTVLLGSAVVVSAFGALPLLESQAAAVAAIATVGFGESVLMSAAAALANDVTPAHLRGSQSALVAQVGDVTFVAMPIALTMVATHAGYPAAFVTTASCIAMANTGFALLARPPPLPAAAAAAAAAVAPVGEKAPSLEPHVQSEELTTQSGVPVGESSSGGRQQP